MFILGQTIDQKARTRDGTEARGNEEREKGLRKGSREGIEKETKRQFEEKEGLRDPPFRISRSEENQTLEAKAED